MLQQQSNAKTDQYQMKPRNLEKLKTSAIHELVRETLQQKLSIQDFAQYNNEDFIPLNKELIEEIKSQLKGLNLPRYKYIVQAVSMWNKGQGIRVGGKAFWDYDSDQCVSEVWENTMVLVLVIVYGIYTY